MMSINLRYCLRCDGLFRSQGPHHRICPLCVIDYDSLMVSHINNGTIGMKTSSPVFKRGHRKGQVITITSKPFGGRQDV